MTQGPTMTITVQYFAVLAERIGLREEVVTPAPGSTVATVLEDIASRHTAVHSMKDSLAVAVNNTYARPAQVIESGDTVAIIPPVSGG